ncbi:MAG: branched-chain amino acid ABC transporter permease [Acidimicrobiia bacterium]
MIDAETGTAALGATPARPPLSLLRRFGPIVVTGLVLALVPLRYGDSRTMMGIAVSGLLFAAYAVAFNVIFGSTGQLFLCMGALAGFGGYASAILSDRAGLPMVLSIGVAATGSGLLGGMFSWIAVRRSLDVIFTGIVTLTFSLSFAELVLGQRNLTGGETGLVVDAGSGSFLRDQVPPYFLVLALVMVYLGVYRWLQLSHIGWAFRALRDDEVAAELAGVNVARYRIYAGIIGSVMLGVAGAVWAHSEGFIGPSTYAFAHVDVRVLVMLAFGGIGTLLGPVLGAAVFTVVDELLISFAQLRGVLYGGVILVLFLFFNRGVIPTLRSLADRVRGFAATTTHRQRP